MCWFQFLLLSDHQTPPRRMPLNGIGHQNVSHQVPIASASPIDLSVRQPTCGPPHSEGDVFIDVESVDNGNGSSTYRNNVCLLHTEPILRDASPIINSQRRPPIIRTRPKATPTAINSSPVSVSRLNTLPLSTHYTTIPTPSHPPSDPVHLPNPFHRFFQTKSNKKQATEKKIISGYALQLLHQNTNDSTTSPNGRKKKSRKIPLHPIAADGPQELVTGKRKVNRCRSPTLPAAKQHKMIDEFDIVMQMESTEYSLEALDNIPIEELFLAEEELNLNDYLM